MARQRSLAKDNFPVHHGVCGAESDPPMIPTDLDDVEAVRSVLEI
jgi:hypothetical protein